MRTELHPQGLEIVTVCLEVTGAETARPLIEAANPSHPSLIDVAHAMDSSFGVVNIPNGIWIDEQGMIVRPAEPAWSGSDWQVPRPPPAPAPAPVAAEAAADAAKPAARSAVGRQIIIDKESYPAALRDWAENGAASPYVLSPDEVVARSHPRPIGVAEAAAHFELAQHLWQAGARAGALHHFREAHRLQPDNWTFKRQAWSLVSSEQTPGVAGRFKQGPLPGHEDDWPFASDFLSDVEQLEPGAYYPQTF